MKDTLINLGITALVFALVGCIPLGIFLAIWLNNPMWLLFCATLIFFL